MEAHSNYSIQNIFYQVGQFDRYAIFDFHFDSDAYKKYGSTIYGYIIYSPSQRAKLKLEITSGNIGNDVGLILLNGALQDKTVNLLLKTEGFHTNDIKRLSTLDIDPIENQYDNPDTKEIPNTIKIDFESEPLSAERMELMLFKRRIEEGIPLIPDEKRRYYSLMLLLDYHQVTEAIKSDILTDPLTGKYYNDVLITTLSPLVEGDRQNSPFKHILGTALGNRRKARVAFICQHLGIAVKHIDKLKTDNEAAWTELMRLVYRFEPETLTSWGWTYHVYWDFERFIHIYLRHYKDFLINESSKGQGTGFQYTIKDIRRLINIILDENKVAIEARLKAGKGFHIQNDKGYYFNGNYYSLKIDSDGRLMQFHPQENI